MAPKDHEARKDAGQEDEDKPGGTTTRPPDDDDDDDDDDGKRNCELSTDPVPVYSFSATPPFQDSLRYRIDVSSRVQCDPTTPDHCRYSYAAEATLERLDRQRRKWVEIDDPAAFVKSFRVGGGIDETVSYERVDRRRADVGLYLRKGPEIAETDITLVISPGGQPGLRATLNRELDLCVPAFDDPECPEDD